MSYIGNPVNSVAFLTDQFSGNGSTTAFTMSVAPANTASVLVAVSGVLQDPSTYSVVGTTLTFSAAPPSGTANISIRYLGIPASGVTTTAYRTLTEFTATAGQTTFSTPSYTVGYLNVYQNGVRLGAADFTAISGTTVVLATGAAAGDLITTESFYVSSVLNAIPATAGSVTQTYLAPNVAGNGPAFRAYIGTNQTIAAADTMYVAQLTTESFDTASCFNNTGSTVGGIPAYAFMPTVPGYYQVNAKAYINRAAGNVYALCGIWKNGAWYAAGSYVFSVSQIDSYSTCSELIYLNGTTDYINMYVQASNTSTAVAGSAVSAFSASLVRAA